jgi:SAM-dependent methyltransferase
LLLGTTVLDVGCGYGRWCHLIQSNYWEAGLAEPPSVDGLDAFEGNVERCRAAGCYRSVWQHMLPDRLDGEWDTVIACEVIEHIAEADVGAVLDELERVARRRVIVTTPNSAEFRGGADTLAGYNDFEAHLSFVPADVFRKRGYRIRGAGWGNPRSRIVRAGQRLRLAPTLHSVPRAFPSLGATIVATKDIAG